MIPAVLESKVAAANRVLQTVKEHFSRPVVAWSSGKDSMVLLALCRRHWPGIPVIFFRESMFPAKYRFANHLAAEWGLNVHDWPAVTVGVREGNGRVDLVRRYPVGPQLLDVSLNLEAPADGEPFACTLLDLIAHRPMSTGIQLPWNVILMGSKAADVDSTVGAAHFTADLSHGAPGVPSVAFPLREWTDDDVWAYTDSANVPQNPDRYEKVDGRWREKTDKKLNSDYFAACYRCLDSREGPEVSCPRLGGLRIKSNRALVPNFPWLGVCPDKPAPLLVSP